MKYINFTTFLFFATLSLFITSCGDDDDNTIDQEELVETYADRYLDRDLYPAVTTRIDNFTQEDAYDFQEDFIDELEDRGEVQSGYKLGFTGTPPLPFGAPEPLYGTLFESQRFENEATIDISETFAAGNAGVEIALIMARDAEYDSSDFPLSNEELMSLIGSIAPLAEFPEIAFEEGPENIDYRDLIAANAGARAYMHGTPIALDAINLDIDNIGVTVFKDGVQTSEGISGDALGSQLDALEFLLQQLADVDEGVSEGQIIATGSLGPDLPLEAGEYELRYEEIGSVKYTLVD